MTQDLAGRESVDLAAPAAFTRPLRWSKDGLTVSAEDVLSVGSEPGRAIEYVVSDAATPPLTADACIRWKPNAPSGVEAEAGHGALMVSWRKVSDEAKIAYYRVDLNPSPALAQLPRKTLGSARPGGATRSISIRGLPTDYYTATVRAVKTYARGTPATIESEVGQSTEVAMEERGPVFNTGLRIVLGGLAVVAFICGLVLLSRGPENRVEIVLDNWAIVIGFLVVFAAISALSAIRTPRDLLSGADSRISTSKVNAALWTVTIGFALVTLTSISIGASHYGRVDPCSKKPEVPAVEKKTDQICSDIDRMEAIDVSKLGIAETFRDGLAANYLVLLGTPFVGLAGAKFIVNRQIKSGSQRVGSGENRFSGALTDDNGNADLADSQYLLFTVVLLFYFYATFLTSPFALPDLPWGLVGLTGLSAATYLANKATNENGLSVDAIVPSSARQNSASEIRVIGRNFLPEGSASFPNGGLAVTLGTQGAEIKSVSSTEVVFTTPDSLSAGSYEVLVTTAANVVGSAGDLRVTD